ncbi:Integral membrane protein TerC [Emticicia oligotrophica DSM 17448]|uniref:Integral membrane protein TerC n=1 Tax=Emticicia oligotrophica (strain DSM 17448 / CIP 109782 / MTCC 6937 / GPTSA100-15) TaxID=929562 RepID=A0ABN4AM81_EMTOG|nr:TerC family protein [Emticicia oligotrophica]AFK02715.1 Integral membrane protein TerC [Emticicia oligotrophica DSM 17448]
MEQIFTTAALTSIFTLTLLEIVLGVDNIIFVSIISSKLPKQEQQKARNIGLMMAMAIRIGLLFVLGWILGLQTDLFNLKDLGLPIDLGFSGKDIILLIGGLFLLYKSTSEIHQKLEGHEENISGSKKASNLSKAIMDIAVINIVFSIDSIITAIGMTNNIIVMAVSVVLSTIAMLFFAGKVGEFVERHPTVKMLALSFLVMIGTLLVAEAFKVHVPKGYIYFSMAFAFLVESLNIKMRKNSKPVDLHDEIK